jgi:hypothetical protein
VKIILSIDKSTENTWCRISQLEFENESALEISTSNGTLLLRKEALINFMFVYNLWLKALPKEIA